MFSPGSPQAYSSPPSRKSSSASNTTTASSALASPPSPAAHETSPPRAWELKQALDELELTPHGARRRRHGAHADDDDVAPAVGDEADEYFPSWKADEAFSLAIPAPASSGWGSSGNSSDSGGLARRTSTGTTPLSSQPAAAHASRQRSASVRSASQRTSPLAQSSSALAPSASTSPSSPSSATAFADAAADAGRLPHLHLLPRPSLTPAQRKYSSSMKSATRHLLSLSLNAGAAPAGSAFAVDDEASPIMQSPEGLDGGGGLPWDRCPPPSFGQATAADDGEFALSALTSPDLAGTTTTGGGGGPRLATKTSYVEMRAHAEERANALRALRRDSDGSPLDEHACVLDEESDDASSSDLSDSDDDDDDSDDAFGAGGGGLHVGGRKRSVRRRSGWRTDTRPAQAAPTSAAFAEEDSDDEHAGHYEYGSRR